MKDAPKIIYLGTELGFPAKGDIYVAKTGKIKECTFHNNSKRKQKRYIIQLKTTPQVQLYCFNCHKKVNSVDLVVTNYEGYDMFVCLDCEKLLKEKSDAPSNR